MMRDDRNYEGLEGVPMREILGHGDHEHALHELCEHCADGHLWMGMKIMRTLDHFIMNENNGRNEHMLLTENHESESQDQFAMSSSSFNRDEERILYERILLLASSSSLGDELRAEQAHIWRRKLMI